MKLAISLLTDSDTVARVVVRPIPPAALARVTAALRERFGDDQESTDLAIFDMWANQTLDNLRKLVIRYDAELASRNSQPIF